MRVERVIVQELFPTGTFANLRLTSEVVLNEGDDPQKGFEYAREQVHEFFKKSYPDLVTEEPVTDIHSLPMDKREQLLIADIYSCKELKVLDSYKLIVRHRPKLEEAFNKMYNILKQTA